MSDIGEDPTEADDRFDRLDRLWRSQGKTLAASEGVHRTLREAILDHILAPGTRLAEEEFAGRFGISRTPVREAILRLEAEGLAARTSGRAAFVTDLSPQEIVEIYEVRAVVDGLAAELAAQHIEPPALSSLEWLNEQLRLAGERGDFIEMARLNLQFHMELADASRNEFLRQMLRHVHDRVRRFPGTTFSHGQWWKEIIQEHEQVLVALRKGDADVAFQVARQHMLSSRDVRVAMLRDSAESRSGRAGA